MAAADGVRVDIALRIFGATLLVFPLWAGAVRFYINEKRADREPILGNNSALTLALSYVVLLGALVGAGSPLLNVSGPELDVAILLAEAFAMLVGAGTMASLSQTIDSDFDANVVQGLVAALWALALFVTIAVWDISIF